MKSNQKARPCLTKGIARRVFMKNFCLFSALGVLTSSLAFGSQPQSIPFSFDTCDAPIQKSPHQGPQGHPGHRGHEGDRGVQGPTGDAGKSFIPAYISLSYVAPAIDISPQSSQTPILPLGIIDTTQPPAFLQYVDPDPSNPLADRYIEVLPGGAGVYFAQVSLYAQTPNFEYPYPDQIPLWIQPQFNRGSGWDTSFPFSVFQTVFTQIVHSSNAYFASAGTAQGMVMLNDGDKFRLAVLEASEHLTIGLHALSPLLSRDVGFSMKRVDTLD